MTRLSYIISLLFFSSLMVPPDFSQVVEGLSLEFTPGSLSESRNLPTGSNVPEMAFLDVAGQYHDINDDLDQGKYVLAE